MADQENNLFMAAGGTRIPADSLQVILLVVSYLDALKNNELDQAGRLMLKIMDVVTAQLASAITPVATMKEIQDPAAVKRIARTHVEQIFKEIHAMKKIQEMDGDH